MEVYPKYAAMTKPSQATGAQDFKRSGDPFSESLVDFLSNPPVGDHRGEIWDTVNEPLGRDLLPRKICSASDTRHWLQITPAALNNILLTTTNTDILSTTPPRTLPAPHHLYPYLNSLGFDTCMNRPSPCSQAAYAR